METARHNDGIDEREKNDILRAKRMKSIADMLEEVEVQIDPKFFNEFYEANSSMFLKRVIANQSVIEMTLLKRTCWLLNCTPKTMKIIERRKRTSSVSGRGRN